MKSYNILSKFFNKANNKALALKVNNQWKWISNNEIIQNINNVKYTLISRNVVPGDRIAYQGNNSPEWIYWNLACQSMGVIWVPMYEDQSKDYCQYIINDCKPTLTISDKLCYSNTINMKNDVENSYIKNDKNIEIKNVKKDDLSTIIYTSGTTGNPKGVMLTHNNLLSNIETIENRFGDINYKTTSLNILPWAHIYSLTTELYYNLYRNNSIALASDKTTFINECREISPDVLYIVPRVLDIIKQKLEKFDKPIIKLLLPKLLNYVLGNNIKYIFVGGAKLDNSTKLFFINNGIKLCEGYGTSETSPMISVNHHTSPRNIMSIGKILDDINVEIIDGEIYVNGPNVMKGYWNNPEKTNEVLIEKDNKMWYKTGDSGYLKDDFLFYEGRISENYKLNSGKFVNVADLESKIKKYINTNFIVYGDGLDSNLLIVEKPFNRSILNIINSKIDKYLHINDVIEIDNFSKYLTPKMSIKRKLLINDLKNNLKL
tara:strand:+ start:1927 stop:3393 length:1467 start_codon:yes stop_codon:yes gene_type:complete